MTGGTAGDSRGYSGFFVGRNQLQKRSQLKAPNRTDNI